MKKLSSLSKSKGKSHPTFKVGKSVKKAQEEKERMKYIKIEEYNLVGKELLSIIQFVAPQVSMLSFSVDFRSNKHIITFYIGQHNRVDAYLDGEGNIKGVEVSGYVRNVENANEVAELELAHLLVSGKMNKIFKEKFPKILQLILELSKEV
jgi:hypothetical protein